MPNQHRYPAKNFRPDPDAEWAPAVTALNERGQGVNATLRAVMRWIVADPDGFLAALAPYRDDHDRPVP